MEVDRPIKPAKAQLARYAVAKHKVQTFADLGACWGVNAGYTLDLLDSHVIRSAYAVDGVVTKLSQERGKKYPHLKFVTGMLGDDAVIAKVPEVDALLMYDILLHQVAPNWDEFITKWAAKTRVLIVYNQNWTLDPRTVRFIDRGVDWYKKHVFHTDSGSVDQWFQAHDDFDPRMGRKRRDVFLFWQWGITTKDLIAHCEKIGFRLDYFDNHGAFAPAFPWIQNEAFIFARK